MSTVTMSTGQRKALARHIFEELNKRNPAVYDDNYSPNLVFHQSVGTDVTGLEAFKQIWKNVFSAFPDAHFTLDDIVAEDNKAAFRYTMTGTFKGGMKVQGKDIAPTGRKITFTQFVFTRSEGEKIVEIWAMQDLLSLYQQMGVPLATK